MKNLHAFVPAYKEIIAEAPEEIRQKVNTASSLKSYEELWRLNKVEDMLSRSNYGKLPTTVKEKLFFYESIIGKNNLLSLTFLKKGLEVARTVCRLVENNHNRLYPKGSGFMVGPGLLMTNHHVLDCTEIAESFWAEFDYELDAEGQSIRSCFFQLDPTSFFMTDQRLDYTIIAVNPFSIDHPSRNIKEYGYNRLGITHFPLLLGESVNIIQHPAGRQKEIAIRENPISDLGDVHIQYKADTEPGSSGSLVANDKWEIIALHHAGVKDRDGDTVLANQGVRMSAILADVHQTGVKIEWKERKRQLLQHYIDELEVRPYRLPDGLLR